MMVLDASIGATNSVSCDSLLREAAGALVQVLAEGWGGAVGVDGPGMEPLRAHGRGARRWPPGSLCLPGPTPIEAMRRAELIPVWLRERIDLAAAARRLVGVQVAPEQNVRGQLVAFAVHAARRRPDLAGPWTGIGSLDPDLEAGRPSWTISWRRYARPR